MNDSIESIIDDCSAPVGAYLERRNLQTDGDDSEREERVRRDLVGRTIAQAGRSRSKVLYSIRSKAFFRVGDLVAYKMMPGTGRVIGSAWGDDGRRCLVVANRQPKRETWLVPLDEAEGVPTREACLEQVAGCMVEGTEAERRRRAEGIVSLIEHYVAGKPYAVR